MKKYTKEKFFADVKKEASLLKKHAKKNELEKLNLPRFEPNEFMNCIYGQMTGDCRSERATKLVLKCCKRFFINGEFDQREGMGAVKKNLNGATIEPKQRKDELNIIHLSSIEAYITLPFAKNKNLISYLKDETNNLVL